MVIIHLLITYIEVTQEGELNRDIDEDEEKKRRGDKSWMWRKKKEFIYDVPVYYKQYCV